MKHRPPRPEQPRRQQRISIKTEQHLDTIIEQFDLIGRKWLIRNLFAQIWGNGAWPSEKVFLEFVDRVAIETINVIEMAKGAPALESQEIELEKTN